MNRPVGLLVGGTLALWAALTYPALRLWGDAVLVPSATAALICLVPALGTLVWALRARRGSPEGQVVVALGGTGVRLLVVVAVAVALNYFYGPPFDGEGFLIWVIVFYLATLSLEMGLLVRQLAAADPSRQP